MGGNRNAGRTYKPRPSPLQQEVSSRPLSHVPLASGPMPHVEPLFWKRFSTAVHLDEVPADEENGKARIRSSSDIELKHIIGRQDWLQEQRQEKRRCRRCCIIITAIVLVIIAGAAVTGVYFAHHPLHIHL